MRRFWIINGRRDEDVQKSTPKVDQKPSDDSHSHFVSINSKGLPEIIMNNLTTFHGGQLVLLEHFMVNH